MENSFSSSSISTKERGMRNLLSLSLAKKKRRESILALLRLAFSFSAFYWIKKTKGDALHLSLHLSWLKKEGMEGLPLSWLLLGKKKALFLLFFDFRHVKKGGSRSCLVRIFDFQ